MGRGIRSFVVCREDADEAEKEEMGGLVCGVVIGGGFGMKEGKEEKVRKWKRKRGRKHLLESQRESSLGAKVRRDAFTVLLISSRSVHHISSIYDSFPTLLTSPISHLSSFFHSFF